MTRKMPCLAMNLISWKSTASDNEKLAFEVSGPELRNKGLRIALDAALKRPPSPAPESGRGSRTAFPRAAYFRMAPPAS